MEGERDKIAYPTSYTPEGIEERTQKAFSQAPPLRLPHTSSKFNNGGMDEGRKMRAANDCALPGGKGGKRLVSVARATVGKKHTSSPLLFFFPPAVFFNSAGSPFCFQRLEEEEGKRAAPTLLMNKEAVSIFPSHGRFLPICLFPLRHNRPTAFWGISSTSVSASPSNFLPFPPKLSEKSPLYSSKPPGIVLYELLKYLSLVFPLPLYSVCTCRTSHALFRPPAQISPE